MTIYHFKQKRGVFNTPLLKQEKTMDIYNSSGISNDIQIYENLFKVKIDEINILKKELIEIQEKLAELYRLKNIIRKEYDKKSKYSKINIQAND